LRAYVLTDDVSYRKTAEQLIDYVFGVLADPDTGLFFGCEDLVRPMPAPDQRERLSLEPMLDHCLYTNANAHMASALLYGWLVLGNDTCRATAEANIEWLWTHLRVEDGGLFHYWNAGQPMLHGLLADSVALGWALSQAYALLKKPEYLPRARDLASYITATHRNPDGGFYDIAEPGPARLQFPVTSLTENAEMARFLIQLADLSGEAGWREEARFALKPFPGQHRVYGAFAAGFGRAVALLLSPTLHVEVEGSAGDAAARTLLRSAASVAQHPGVCITFEAGKEPDIRVL
jgi:uncharacterized protein YyaL (SSP411 family)